MLMRRQRRFTYPNEIASGLLILVAHLLLFSGATGQPGGNLVTRNVTVIDVAGGGTRNAEVAVVS